MMSMLISLLTTTQEAHKMTMLVTSLESQIYALQLTIQMEQFLPHLMTELLESGKLLLGLMCS